MLTNEEFYDRLARFYDVMNDWPARLAYEGPFIRQVLHEYGARSVLDVACGTGRHTVALQGWGFSSRGTDSSARMVELARAHAASLGLDVPFDVAGFQDVASLPGSPFDAVLCIGNSLPHVCTEQALDDALSGMAGALRPGGVFILHNLNYDRRWIERPRFLKLDSGSLDGKEVLVWRMADYEEDSISFHTALFEQASAGQWSVNVNSTCQKPLFRAALEEKLLGGGFRDVRAFGNLNGDPFDVQSSGDLVLVAMKSS